MRGARRHHFGGWHKVRQHSKSVSGAARDSSDKTAFLVLAVLAGAALAVFLIFVRSIACESGGRPGC